MADSVAIEEPVPFHKQLWAIKETLVIILTPLLLLPLPIAVPGKEASCAYVILIMAIYWMTEALPMAVTALLPVVLMPWLDVMSSKQLCSNYLKDANMLFFGGLLVAVAVEKWGLHKRVALRVLMLVGSKPVWILFGFMSVTGFLSMWLSNTACAAMMIPIACAVLKELNEHRLSKRNPPSDAIELQPMNGDAAADGAAQAADGVDNLKGATVVVLEGEKKLKTSISESEKEPLKAEVVDETQQKIQWEKEDKEFRNFACALKLCVAYASNVGGTGTLIGCGPNIVMKGMADSLYGPENGLDFTSWFILAFPNMLLDLILAWLSLVFLFLGRKAFASDPKDAKEDDETSANAVIRREYIKLGKMTFAEASVMTMFIILALMWLLKSPGFMPGWLLLLPYHKEGPYVTDSSVAITICVLLFILPSELPNYFCLRRWSKNKNKPVGPAVPLLDWPTVNKQMPWSVILLLGGGFALADACKGSGLSLAIGNALISFQVLPAPAIALIMVVITTVFTTFTSNVSTTTIMLPITAQLANAIEVHPFYLMLPVTIAASFSYILPVSTPPNAIVYAYGDITMMDMIKTGLVNCCIHILLLQVAINTWGKAFFDLGHYPDWAPRTQKSPLLNSTDPFNSTLPISGLASNATFF